MAHWLKVEPKQSTLFFNIHISFSIIEEEVEHAMGMLDDEAWKTCESKSFFKVLLSFKTKSNYFEIETILFFKELFYFKTKSSFEDKISFFFKTSSQSFLFFKILFSIRASLSWDFNESLSIEISSLSYKTKPSLEDKFLFSSFIIKVFFFKT